MNFRTLRYIEEVVRQQSFTKAAQALKITQPSLSQTIARAEAELGVALFDRKASPVIPTEEGRMVADYAQRILSAYREMLSRLSPPLRTKQKTAGHWDYRLSWTSKTACGAETVSASLSSRRDHLAPGRLL